MNHFVSRIDVRDDGMDDVACGAPERAGLGSPHRPVIAGVRSDGDDDRCLLPSAARAFRALVSTTGVAALVAGRRRVLGDASAGHQWETGCFISPPFSAVATGLLKLLWGQRGAQ